MAALQELAHQNGDQAEGDADQADDVHGAGGRLGLVNE
jgi:hypothetical protein